MVQSYDYKLRSEPIYKIMYSKNHDCYIKIVVDYNYFKDSQCIDMNGESCEFKKGPHNSFSEWLWWNIDGRKYVTGK